MSIFRRFSLRRVERLLQSIQTLSYSEREYGCFHLIIIITANGSITATSSYFDKNENDSNKKQKQYQAQQEEQN